MLLTGTFLCYILVLVFYFVPIINDIFVALEASVTGDDGMYHYVVTAPYQLGPIYTFPDLVVVSLLA